MKRTACCYCRYSSDKQQQQSIEYQLEKIVDFCDKNSITLLNNYIDEATTGTNDNRESFQKMIEDSQYAQWDYLIVYNMSRLSRNVEDQMFYQKLLRQRGVMVISVEERFEKTPEGDLFNLITAGINEYYSKNLAKRSFGGVMQNAKKALVIGGVPPIGYDVGSDKKYIINSKEAEAVKIIFDKYAEGWTYKQINEYLNENGYRTKENQTFRYHHLDTLTNRKYIGEYIFNRTSKISSRGTRKYREKSEDEIVIVKDGMPRIIDDLLFKKVQHRIKYSRALHKKPAHISKYLLSGTMVCGKCGKAYSGTSSFPARSKKPYFYYRHSRVKLRSCTYDDIQIKFIDTWVLKKVIPDIFNFDNLKEIQQKINLEVMNQKAMITDHIKSLNDTLKIYEDELNLKNTMLREAKMNLFILEEIKDIKRKIVHVNKEIKTENNRLESLEKVTLEDVRNYLNENKKMLKKITSKENLDEFIRGLIGKVEITKEEMKFYLSYDRIMSKFTGVFILVSNISRQDNENFTNEFLKNNSEIYDQPNAYKKLLKINTDN
jgi:site-specific DNA recombinase